jgi:hypothetical protein
MKNIFKLTALTLMLVQSGFVSANQIFVTDLIDGSGSLPIDGNQAYAGQLGDDFIANADFSITSIGVFDDNGDGTVEELYWQLFNVTSGTLIHSETISASGPRTAGTTIEDNYLWADLASAITLFAGQTYSAVAYGFNLDDKNFNTNYGLTTLDVMFNSTDLTSAGGRYSGAFGTLPNAGAGNVASTQAYNFGAATFEYSAVPEPSILFLFGLGLAGLGISLKRKPA